MKILDGTGNSSVATALTYRKIKTIKNVTNEEYQSIDERMQSYANGLEDNAYVIPEGGSNEIGVWGYVECFYEILDQIKQQSLNIDTIMVATGSGGTHAGLLIGKYLAESDIDNRLLEKVGTVATHRGWIRCWPGFCGSA